VIFIWYLFISQIATQLTHALTLHKKFDAVRASSLLTLVFNLITSFIHHEFVPVLQAIFLGSSFVGMTEPTRLSRGQLALASVVFCLNFHFLLSYLKGYGGTLGLAAFISCLFVHYLGKISRRAKTFDLRRAFF
jgi:hypothetical protein